MELDALLHAVADRVATLPGLTGGAHYPPGNAVPVSPVAMIRLSPLIPTTVEPRFGEQLWLPMIDVVLLVASAENRPGDAARLDPLIPAVLDLFDAGRGAQPLDVPGHVDRIWHTAQVRRGAGPWGSTGYCHTAVITLDGKFRR
jgi:hypothetical protein